MASRDDDVDVDRGRGEEAEEEINEEIIEEEEEEEEEGEDLMDENMAEDYVAIPELDRYDEAMLDEREYEEMDAEARRQAEKEIDVRLARVEGRVLEDLEEDVVDRAHRERREEEEVEDVIEEEINLEGMGECPLREWIAQERTRREIKRRFAEVLSTETYAERVRSMCSRNSSSLEVSYEHMSRNAPILATWVIDAPRDMLEIFDEVAREVTLSQFPAYDSIRDEIKVRIGELPLKESLRDLRRTHLNQLVCVRGVATRRSGVFPQLRLVKFACSGCGMLLGPFKQQGGGGEVVKPSSCPNCKMAGPFRIAQEETMYRNYQRLAVQEPPSEVPAGRMPRHKEVVLLSDLIDAARPGEEVEITGIYCHSYDSAMLGGKSSGFPIFATTIEANHVVKLGKGQESTVVSEDDEKVIRKLARDSRIQDRIVASIAPSIFGQKFAKKALATALFGGCSKQTDSRHRTRGDVNVFLLGDPGCAKSQLLKYCCGLVPRAVYTTGKGASAVGLTAGVHKDPVTKEWTLEGGALVLADNGVCAIDEFDKMNEQDRTSIHEAMEQQSISVSKAGIVTTLQARCAVCAAANPIGGQYDSSLNFAQNVELTDPILQRFDILCVLQDVVDPIFDERLASYVVASHQRAKPLDDRHRQNDSRELVATSDDDDRETIPQHLLRKYVTYARETCRPRLQQIDQSKVSRLYADLRRESITCGGVPVAVRHLESLIRIAEAHAKMALRDYVLDSDLDAAIAVVVKSFIDAQKTSVRAALHRGFRKYTQSASDYFDLLLHALRALVREAQTYASFKVRAGAPQPDHYEVLLDDLEHKARDYNIADAVLDDFLQSPLFNNNHFKLIRHQRIIIWAAAEQHEPAAAAAAAAAA
ncbi:hypothetical protein CTAYLR_004887 [Chrysophaeum taylorii]|uniref:DNA replication licensing factor MCM2 n=1 Tax=Chrysophaeum taylorii TaxID=2483200 RepID=A0AAD7UE11_9STRA|nr:hypothetical protein CTAYLR_004887 [Chrysophaeum taylorii]